MMWDAMVGHEGGGKHGALKNRGRFVFVSFNSPHVEGRKRSAGGKWGILKSVTERRRGGSVWA